MKLYVTEQKKIGLIWLLFLPVFIKILCPQISILWFLCSTDEEKNTSGNVYTKHNKN